MQENSESVILEEQLQEQHEGKRRKPWIAFLLSLITPGLGQVYNGQIKKGALFLGLLFIPLLLASMINLVHTFNGFVVLAVIELSLRLYIIVDSIKVAKQQDDFVPRSYNRWYYHLVFAIAVLTILQLFPAHSILRVHSFKISTDSNIPVLETNDMAVADMTAYRNRKPEYGELVAFNSPQGGVCTFRVVGLPGDKIYYDGSFLSINNKKCRVEDLGERLVEGWPLKQYIEELPNGFKHQIFLYNGDDRGKRETRSLTVPPHSYYLMGDSRDNALDSRFIGPIAAPDILGRFLYTYWGRSFDRINVDLTK
ncbi:signal peptidase I [Desertivirga arenae]|uniref:signal peptidase I n=1 Tax=Desertivirga arenae TaxID=2810309 RepID=UPI001A97698F|nr:signal peptidase I [Pedobacter sp. SYSU D00823]